MLDVAVVVVTYNSRDLLPDLVASLPRGLGELRWRLVVADNDSKDGTVAWLHEHAPDALVVATGRNGGYAAGLNAGVAAARETYGEALAYLLMNPDVRLQPGCAARRCSAPPATRASGSSSRTSWTRTAELIESQRREPTVLRALGDAVLGCRLAGRVTALGEVVTDPRAYTGETTTDWAEGSTQLVTAECWARVRTLGRVVLPLLGGDRLRSAGARRRLRTALPADGACVHLEGGSGLAAAVGAAHGQPGAAVPAPQRAGRHRRLLGGHAAARRQPGRARQGQQQGGRGGPAQPRSAARTRRRAALSAHVTADEAGYHRFWGCRALDSLMTLGPSSAPCHERDD